MALVQQNAFELVNAGNFMSETIKVKEGEVTECYIALEEPLAARTAMLQNSVALQTFYCNAEEEKVIWTHILRVHNNGKGFECVCMCVCLRVHVRVSACACPCPCFCVCLRACVCVCVSVSVCPNSTV